MSKPLRALQSEIFRLRGLGMEPHAIAKQLQIRPSKVRYTLDENGERRREWARKRAQRQCVGITTQMHSLIEPHIPKLERPVNVDRQVRVIELSRRHVAGEVDLPTFTHLLRQAYAQGAGGAAQR